MPSLKAIGFKAAFKEIQKQSKNVKFAGVLALTKTAVIVKADVQEEMRQSYDRPTRYTLNSVFIQPANKSTLQTRVGFKTKASGSGRSALNYLAPTFSGKDRRFTGVESVLKRRGLLPPGKYVVPGDGVRLNKHGNITKNQAIKILRGIGRKGPYFVGRINGTHGVWLRKGGAVRPIFIFVSKPKYQKIFDFHKTAERSFNKNFNTVYEKSLFKFNN